MTLYFDSKVKFSEAGVISTILEWHPVESFLAVASYSQDKGGFITIFDENGSAVEGNEEAAQAGQQASALAWHPQRPFLAVGWEDGQLHVWRSGQGWQPLQAPHSAPPLLLSWSAGGGRLIVSDAAGAVTGWRSTPTRLLTTFHLTLEEPLTHAAYCPIGMGTSENVLRGLAKAAVAGDEGALDVLASWRPRTAPRITGGPGDNHSLYCAQQNGNLLYIDESGTCSEVLPSIGNVRFMTMTPLGGLIVAWEISGTLSLTRFSLGHVKGTLEAKVHVKMTTRSGLGVTSAGGASVAILAGETSVRIWDSETNDNLILPMEEASPTHNSEMFTSMGFCTLTGAVCCGSNQGRVFVWRKNPYGQWGLINVCSVKGSIKQVCWGSQGGIHPLLAVNSVTSVSVLREQPICWGYNQRVWGVQKGPTQVSLEGTKGALTIAKTDISIRAMCLSDTYLAVSDGKEVQVLKIGKDSFNFLPIYKFLWQTETLLLHDETLVGIVGSRIEAKSVTGTTLGALHSVDSEGEPIGISRTERYLVIATMDGCIKIGEITKKGLRSPFAPKNCYQLFEDFGEIMYAGINTSGRLVCLAIATANLIPDPKLYLWEASNDTLTHTVLKGAAGEPCVPITICWDLVDPRLLACHVRSTSDDSVRCLFTHNGNLIEHKDWGEIKDVEIGFNLCAMSAPQIITMQENKLIKTTLREFVGSEECDSTTRSHLLDYLYYMTIGQMEQAVVAIGNTGAGDAVWKGLAKACVSQKRLDVAAVCLAKMNDVKGALALHMAMEDPKLDDKCRTAILAINLGMLEEAKQLLEESGRYDMLFKLTAATRGGLEKLTTQPVQGEAALLVKNAHYRLGCIKRDAGELEAASECFEKAGVDVPQVPRMLLQAGQAAVLKHKVSVSKNPEMHKWWAHYLEGQGELDGALEQYEIAVDWGARARLLCHTDRLEEALTLSDKPQAAYHIGRHLELQADKSEDAVKMYMRAGALAAAVRCAAEAELWDLVGRAGGAGEKGVHTLAAAVALENAGLAPIAATLYHKAGKLHKAVEVALQAEGESGAEALRRVVESLAAAPHGSCDATLARKLVQPLLSASQPEQAASILASAQLYEEALELIEEHNIEISDEVAERLSPEKGAEERTRVLTRLADLLGRRGVYHMAAKKLTQAGDKVGAMRWLVKSGDIDKMLFFAQASRDRAVYLMAARALQAADWRARPALLRRVAILYEKAKAPRPLAAFYAACARQEIDEYENYEKASGALSEALRSLSRTSDPLAASDAVVLQGQADQVQRYLDIEKAFQRDYQGAMSAAKRLLNELDSGSRAGNNGPVRPHHLLRLMAKRANAAGQSEDAQEYAEQANIFEKRTEMLTHSRNGAETPSSDQDIPEYLPEELPT